MNPDFLINGVLRSVIGGGGRKRSKKAMRYLTGRHGSFWSNPTTVLTAAGLAWGIVDTLTNKGTGAGGQWGGGTGHVPAQPAAMPMPAAGAPAAAAPLPPLPNVADAAGTGVDANVLRLVRLAISAAGADGVMNEQERAAILQQAQAAGVGDVVERELQQRRPLAELVAGVNEPTERATLYVLAYTVLRADEQLTGAERIYLAQLATLLGLDPPTTARLEKDTGERIDALGDQGQLGG